jgi:hypothetical protein
MRGLPILSHDAPTRPPQDDTTMYSKVLHYTPLTGWSEPVPQGWDSPDTIGFVFSAPRYMDEPAPLLALTQAMPNVRWCGGSTAGEIRGAQLFDDTIQVCLVRLERSQVRAASMPIQTEDRGYTTGVRLGQALRGDGLRGVIVISDGLLISGADLASGLEDTLGCDIPITGGLAGDGTALARTWVLIDGQPRTGHVSAIGLYGDHIRVSSSARGGWSPFGPTRRITRARHNVLYELDGKPALALYKEYLGELADELPMSGMRFPLQVSKDGEVAALIRTVIAIDEVEQSITFTGDVHEGDTARLMRSTIERLVDGAQDAYDAVAEHSGEGMVMLTVSCVGRRLAMGPRTDEELEGIATLSAQDQPSPVQIGFYSYGELSPGSAGAGGCSLHNQTMTLTVLREV